MGCCCAAEVEVLEVVMEARRARLVHVCACVHFCTGPITWKLLISERPLCNQEGATISANVNTNANANHLQITSCHVMAVEVGPIPPPITYFRSV